MLPILAVPVMTSAEVAALSRPMPVQAAPLGAAVLRPDEHGVIDLIAAEPPQPADPLPNPFRVRYRPPPPAAEAALRITALASGEDPAGGSCLISGTLCAPGESVQGFTVARIEVDGVVLQRGPFFLFVPMQDGPVTVRFHG
jgi:hypothetical protein